MPETPALERAWDWLNQGLPRRALAVLTARVPAALSGERNFLAAEAWRAMGYFSKAEAFYRKVLSRPQAVGPDLPADSALALASIHRSLGRVARARNFLALARRLSGSNRADDFARRMEMEGALIDRAQGLYPRSVVRLKKLLAAFEFERDFASSSFVLWALGGARRFSGDLPGAMRDFKESLDRARQAKDSTAEAYAFLGLGGASRVAGRPQDSRRFYAQAAKLLSKTQDAFGQAYAECGLANALRQLGDYALARSRYRKAHRLYSSLGDAVDLAYVDWGLGQAALHLGDASEAERRFKIALAAFLKAGEARGVVISRMALAFALHAQGKTASAETHFNRALALSRKAKIRAHLETLT